MMVANNDYSTLEEKIGYIFNEPALLMRSLTRLAYAKEHGMPEDAHMDALATLGDAVIDVFVITALVESGDHDKGIISNKKMDLVNMTQLRRLAESLALEEYVRWGKGERIQHVWTSGRVLAECMEALAGAAYLDGGIDAVECMLAHLEFPAGSGDDPA